MTFYLICNQCDAQWESSCPRDGQCPVCKGTDYKVFGDVTYVEYKLNELTNKIDELIEILGEK